MGEEEWGETLTLVGSRRGVVLGGLGFVAFGDERGGLGGLSWTPGRHWIAQKTEGAIRMDVVMGCLVRVQDFPYPHAYALMPQTFVTGKICLGSECECLTAPLISTAL